MHFGVTTGNNGAPLFTIVCEDSEDLGMFQAAMFRAWKDTGFPVMYREGLKSFLNELNSFIVWSEEK